MSPCAAAPGISRSRIERRTGALAAARCGFVYCQGILAIALRTNKYVETQSEHNFFVVFQAA
jgi:hypothetical protein